MPNRIIMSSLAIRKGIYTDCIQNTETKEIVSPLFDDFYALAKWMRQNGWILAEYVGQTFVPLRVISPI